MKSIGHMRVVMVGLALLVFTFSQANAGMKEKPMKPEAMKSGEMMEKPMKPEPMKSGEMMEKPMMKQEK